MKWLSTWKYLPLQYETELAGLENRTQRVSFRNNLSGGKVRVLLSNRYSRAPLTITAMTIGEEVEGKLISSAVVTLCGSEKIMLAPGEEVYSDEIALPVSAGRRIAVSLYVKERQSIQSICCYWARNNTTTVLNIAGDETAAERLTPADLGAEYPALRATDATPEKGEYFFGFSAVQVLTVDDAKLLACFGDSITHMSYVTNELMKRLYAAYPGKVALINCGIGGNRLMHDATFIAEAPGQGRFFGTAGLTRFEKDVYGMDDPDTVLVLEGINDIMHPVQLEGAEKTTPACVITAGYEMLAGLARRHGSRILGATLMPCSSETYPEAWNEAFDACRREVNDWLRSKHPFDGLFDYSAAVEDGEKQGYMRPGFTIGDGLHPSYLGAEYVVDSIDLNALF